MQVVERPLGASLMIYFLMGKIGVKFVLISSLPVLVTPILGHPGTRIFDGGEGDRGCDNIRPCDMFMTF